MDMIKNVPVLRFPEFSGDWEVKLYGEIYSFYSTNSLSRDKLNYDNENVKNIHYGDIHTKFNTMFNIKNEYVPFINSDVNLSKIKKESYCLNGDLVIADASENYDDIGKTMEIINLNDEKVIAGLHTFLARPNNYDMALGYAGYLLQSWKVRKQIMTIAQGTKVLSLSTSRLAKINLNLPQFKEQTKIANFLTQIDSKIGQLSKKKQLLERYKKGVMQNIFSQALRFKDDNGNAYPDWEVKKLELIATFHRGGGLSKSDLDNKGSNECIHYGELFTLYNEVINIVNSKTNKNEGVKSKVGDILMPSSDVTPQGLGKASVLMKSNVLLGGDINIIRSNERINSIFLSYLINYDKNKVIRLVTGTTVKHIYTKDLKVIVVNFPSSFKEQTKIANFLTELDQKINLVEKQLNGTKDYKKGLLQQLFV
ncbi:MAG: restriction endonuclease subunit S [Methylococcales bacterium]|nr:restriction endonuclease subunit S [Methylococcales bacterium]